jgi:hypothetical protein
VVNDVASVSISSDSAKASVASFTGGGVFGGDEVIDDLVGHQRWKNVGRRDRLTFSCQLADGFTVRWQTILVDGCVLYIMIPDEFQPVGSRDSLVNLLDYAEGTLECRDIVVCLKNNRPDVVRLFMYLGFSVLDPTDPLVCVSSVPGTTYMTYHVTDDIDDDEDDDIVSY